MTKILLCCDLPALTSDLQTVLVRNAHQEVCEEALRSVCEIAGYQLGATKKNKKLNNRFAIGSVTAHEILDSRGSHEQK